MTRIHVCRESPVRIPHRGGPVGSIYGIGPSLDVFHKGPTGPRIAINEAILSRPTRHWGCGLFWDLPPLLRAHEYYAANFRFLPPPRPVIVEYDIWNGKRGPGAEWLHDDHRNSYYRREDVVAADARPGTACVALLLLADAGVKRVRLVGFDSFWWWRRRAPEWPPKTPEARAGWEAACQPAASVRAIWDDLGYSPKMSQKFEDYKRICDAILRTARKCGITLLDEGGEP